MQQHCNMRYGSPVGYNKTRLRVKGELYKTSHGMEVIRKKSDVQRAQSIYGVRGHLYADLKFDQVYSALSLDTPQKWRKRAVPKA